MNAFHDELDLYGPEGTAPAFSETESLEYCRRLARSHYENFSVASFLLPKPLRDPMMVVYAYCRWSDDLGDELGGSEAERQKSLELLDWWEKELKECFTGKTLPKHPVFRALQPMVTPFDLPQKPFADLLKAFKQDQTKRDYETLDELLGYCQNSADPVGRIVLHLAYTVSKHPLPLPTDIVWNWSDTICTGLQLANFWQDVARDARLGRCYIPKDVTERFGVDLKDVLEGNGIRCEPEADAPRLAGQNAPQIADLPAFREMLRFLVGDARKRLLRGKPLISAAPKLIRTDLQLFLRGGLAILDAIEKIDYNVLRKRPIVSSWDKLSILVRAFLNL